VTWKQIQEGTELTRALLDELGLASFLKTSGGKGLHVIVPLTPKDDWDAVKAVAKAIVEHMATVIPDRFVAKSGRRTGSAGSSSTTCATASARPPPAPGRRAPRPASASRCRAPGTSSAR
jgi:bifunctional non-homologous end joining protein LigD